MSNNFSYNLVHIVTSGEYKTPLVASQVFDRAQAQASIEGPGKPLSVSVWIIVPMREVFEKGSKEIIRSLKKRCPAIQIKIVGGISRLGNWPVAAHLRNLRKSLWGKTIYHCRGESSFDRVHFLKKKFPDDAIVIDIRGYWPLERLLSSNVVYEEDMNAAQKTNYENDVKRLTDTITNSEWLCTVSEPLRQFLIRHCHAAEDSVLIPCCVNTTIADTNRDKIRLELGIGDKTAILYLGGTQKYQYLEDLVIPFVKSALSQSEKYIAVFITQDKEKMDGLLTKSGVNMDNVRIISLPQGKVADYLTAMDLGLLLRASSTLNNFSQPVKFGEYLSAGIPVVLEEGTGNISGMLNKNNIGCVIQLAGKNKQSDFDNEVRKALDWFQMNKDTVRQDTRKFVEAQYTWKANMQRERNMYVSALEKAADKK